MELISNFLTVNSAWIGLGLLIGLITLFALEKFPPVIVAVASAALTLILGYLPREDMEQVFANPAPITIAAMFILSGALVRTGVVEAVASAASRRTKRFPRLSIVEIFSGTFFASALVNNTPVVIILIPVIRQIARVARVSAKFLLIPLSYLSIMGGTLTLIGTSTNLLVDGIAQREGEPAFGIFELTQVGLIAAAAGIAFLLIAGRYMLPVETNGESDSEDASPLEKRYLTELLVEARSPLIGTRYAELPLLSRAGISLTGLRRGHAIHRKIADDALIAAGDRILLAADQTELFSLADTLGDAIGVANAPSHLPKEQLRIVQASIAPTHPALGRRLSEIPFLAKTRARILGVSRSRHLAGPTLSDVKLRAADHLLIQGGPDCIRAIESNVNLIDIAEPEARPFRRLKAPIAILTMLGIIGLASIGVWSIEMLAITGVAVVLLARCIDPEEAWRSIDGNVIVLIFGMLAFGVGLQQAGTVDLIVGAAMPYIAMLSPLFLLIAIYTLTSLLTETVTNNAVAVIMTPIVLSVAENLGIDPRPLLFAVMFAASASFATPIGYQTNTIVYAAGNYRFADFLKIGVPMNIVVGLATCVAIDWLVWR
ncbi:MAG: SLC13 family permease [Erythrobacter sp.]|uniref:SLC13 family permease n=1 Tax=Erythrobacter sp. TaxID=1042 RepID=UPI001AFCD19F|nr:SLC13 family permease [Erythrobacter sp.]MBO6766779.1 SLC13 family permease [Erythrobacter sp.]